MMTFLNPLDALIPNIPFSLFADFWVWAPSEGVLSIEPFYGGGLAGRLYPPPSPTNENPDQSPLHLHSVAG